MTAIATVRSLVITQIPLAPDMLIDRVLIEIARDFCAYTRAWRSTVAANVTADTLGVALTPPTDGELVDVVKATLNGNPLTKKTHEQLDALVPKWRTTPAGSSYITKGDTLNEVLVAPLSSTTYASGLSVRAAWKPALTATTLDDMLISNHSDALIDGVLGKLFGLPDKPWTSGGLASHYQASFQIKKDVARQQTADGDMKGVVRKVRYGGL